MWPHMDMSKLVHLEIWMVGLRLKGLLVFIYLASVELLHKRNCEKQFKRTVDFSWWLVPDPACESEFIKTRKQ